MAVDVQTETIISRPSTEVSSYAADPANAPSWYTRIRAVNWLTPQPLAEGSRVAFVAQFLGKRLAYTYEVTEWAPGRKLVMGTADGPFPMETTYAWQALAGGKTRMVLRNRGEPQGFSKWIVPFMAMAIRRQNRKDLRRLKALLERQ
jgi:hypothetical protein